MNTFLGGPEKVHIPHSGMVGAWVMCSESWRVTGGSGPPRYLLLP